jgi:hypothetical protein
MDTDPVDPRADTDIIIRKHDMNEHLHGHGSGGYRTDQRVLLRSLLSAIATALVAVLCWLVVNMFNVQSAMALMNLKFDLMMDKLHVEQPKSAK